MKFYFDKWPCPIPVSEVGLGACDQFSESSSPALGFIVSDTLYSSPSKIGHS